MIGRVRMYSPAKRFGYIDADDGQEYFVHESEIRIPSRCLSAGCTVQFTPSSTGYPKKQAVDVSLL